METSTSSPDDSADNKASINVITFPLNLISNPVLLTSALTLSANAKTNSRRSMIRGLGLGSQTRLRYMLTQYSEKQREVIDSVITI